VSTLIQPAEVQAWAEASKLPITSLDTVLLDHVQTIVLGALGRHYDPATIQSLWVTPETTPAVVRTLVSMKYVSLYYDRQYSENEGGNPWARRLDRMFNDLLDQVIEGDIDLPEVPGVVVGAGGPRFYPTDSSSAESGPTDQDPSAGPPSFTMGMVF
jgi:hypothetical protein